MIWSFLKKKTIGLNPEVETAFRNYADFLNDDAEQVRQYPESLKMRLLAGSNADSVPGAVGSFGLCATNPIPVNGPIGEILYLSALRFGERRVLFHRVGAFDDIDRYECVSDDGKHWDVLFLDMYHPRKSGLAPRGYSIAQNVLLSGVHQQVPKFPEDLYPAIVDYTTRRFGFSVADPRIRLNMQSTTFQRPQGHAERISKIIRGDFELNSDEFAEQLASEALGAQASLYDRLVGLTAVGLRRDDVRVPEIAYFVLSLTVHAIFCWSRNVAKSDVSDKVSLRVLEMNKEANSSMPSLPNVVRNYQERFSVYRSAILQIAKIGGSDEFSFQFGLLLSRNLVGKESPLVGAMLCAAAMTILAEMKALIAEVEYSV